MKALAISCGFVIVLTLPLLEAPLHYQGKTMAGPKKKKGSSSSDDLCQNCDTLQEILKPLQETNKSLQDTVKILTDRLNSVEETLNELTSQKQVDSASSSAISSGIEKRIQEIEQLL